MRTGEGLSAAAAAPAQQARRRRMLRGSTYAAVAVVLLVAGIWLARAGIVGHRFPGFVPGQKHAVITAYSGPHLAGAIGLGAIAGVLLVMAATDWWRSRRGRPGGAASHEGLG